MSQAGCVNVVTQKEAECGPISVALAVKLCFSAEEEKTVFEKLVDVRRDLVDSLKRNDLVDFESKKRLLRWQKGGFIHNQKRFILYFSLT